MPESAVGTPVSNCVYRERAPDMLRMVYPKKCILCDALLSKNETDLCLNCRMDAPEFAGRKRSIPFVAKWTALWYYRDNIVKSIHRFKFCGDSCYADSYGRLLHEKVLEEELFIDCNLISWVPISRRRRFVRGYDQSELLAKALALTLGVAAVKTLNKIRHTPPQSATSGVSSRKANVLGVYRVDDPHLIRGKRILLVDDVLTTGATVSECARTLLTAGAREVRVVTLASSYHKNKKKYR